MGVMTVVDLSKCKTSCSYQYVVNVNNLIFFFIKMDWWILFDFDPDVSCVQKQPFFYLLFNQYL